MFSWIHQSNGAGPPNVEEKRKIRSHVTRRLALQRTVNHTRATNDPGVGALDAHSAWRRHQRKRRSTSQALKSKVEPESQSAISNSFEDAETMGRRSFQPGIALPTATDSERPPAAVARVRQRQNKRTDVIDSPYHSQGRVIYSPSPEHLLSMWAIEMPDPGNAMLRLCALQMHRFRPEVSIEQASDVTGCVWGASPCQILAYALCLASLGHLYSNSSGHASDIVATFKGKVFHEIIRRISVTDAPLSDEMVPSILCLTQFELSRASLESRTHLQALNTIYKTKPHESPAGLPIMFEALDILHSIMFSIPTVTALEVDDIPATTDTDNITAKLMDELDAASSLIEEGDRMLVVLERMILELKRTLRSILDCSCYDAGKGEMLSHELDDFRSTYCEGFHRSVRQQHVARQFYHSFAIWYNVLLHRRSFRHQINAKHATNLYIATRSRHNSLWTKMPFLHLWVLAIALSSSSGASEQSLFQDRLATAIYHMGAPVWDGVKAFLCSFLRLRSHLDLLSQPPTPKKRTAKRKPADHSTSCSPITTQLPRLLYPTRQPPATGAKNKTQIYPEMSGRYPFSAAAALDPAEDARTLHKGYAWLSADAKFGKILARGESSRISFMGVSLPEEGYLALF